MELGSYEVIQTFSEPGDLAYSLSNFLNCQPVITISSPIFFHQYVLPPSCPELPGGLFQCPIEDVRVRPRLTPCYSMQDLHHRSPTQDCITDAVLVLLQQSTLWNMPPQCSMCLVRGSLRGIILGVRHVTPLGSTPRCRPT